MKKLSLLLIVALIFLLANTAFAQDFKAGMVTDVGGLGDQSFNDAAYRGLKQAEEELGIKISVIESNTMTDYVPNLSSLAEQGYDMVWAVGFLMTDALEEVSQMYPDTKFGLIDSVVKQPNVVSVTFAENEGSFLAGVAAAMESKTGTVGFIGGMETTLIKKFEAGFRAGVKTVKPDMKILIGYTGVFDDPGAGKELSLTQFNQGADVIYHASGACGIGVIKAAEEKDLYAIGVDSPQYHLAPNNVLTSMVKRIDVAVLEEVKALYNGNFSTGVRIYNLQSDGVGLYMPQAKKMLSQETLDKVDMYKNQIINGKISVPETPKNL
nr:MULTISPECIES: BMP family ABC transporter substrate-binding protein [unclassified Halanaerobium]